MVQESENKARKSQRMAALTAVLILVGLLVIWPVGGGFADWANAANAPTDATDRYEAVATQDTVTFDMDATAFKNSGSYKSYYIWENSSGDVHYSNLTNTAGLITVTEDSTANVEITGNISWNVNPYFRIYFDYTAKQAYDDNVVRIRLYLSGVYVSAHEEARTITLTSGGVTFFTKTLPKTDTDTYVDENITINVNDLRRAIVNSGGGEEAYFKLKITAQDTTLSIANSMAYAYKVTKLTQRDDALFLIGAVACAITVSGIFLVQPKYSIPLGKSGTRKGGF